MHRSSVILYRLYRGTGLSAECFPSPGWRGGDSHRLCMMSNNRFLGRECRLLSILSGSWIPLQSKSLHMSCKGRKQQNCTTQKPTQFHQLDINKLTGLCLPCNNVHTAHKTQQIFDEGNPSAFSELLGSADAGLQAIPYEDELVALHVFNTAEASILADYRHVTPALAELIAEFRTQHGHIKCLTDLLQIRGMANVKLGKIVNAIVGNRKKDFSDVKKSDILLDSKIISPKLRLHKFPDSVVACSVQLNAVCWAHIDSDLEVCDWNIIWLMEEFQIKYNHALYQEKLWKVGQQIPQGGVYLMEELPLRLASVKGASVMTTRCYMDAVLTTLLNHREEQGRAFHHHVYKLRTAEVSRFFNLLVGGERVGCQDTVTDIMHGRCDPAAGVYVPEGLVNDYYRKSSKSREVLGQCLLQAIAFYKLLAQRNPHLEHYMQHTASSPGELPS